MRITGNTAPQSKWTLPAGERVSANRRKSAGGRRRIQFSSRTVSRNALIALILGAISLVSGALMVYLAYKNGGQARLQEGAVLFLCLLMAVAGMILAILSRREPDKRYVLSYLAMAVNGLVLLLCSAVMYLGTM